MIKERSRERVTVRVSDRLADMFSDIQKLTPAESPTDVVRRALIVYHSLVIAQSKGAKLLIVEDDPETGEPTKRPIFL